MEQNIQLLWEQRDFVFTVKQCLVSDDKSTWWVHARHKPLFDGDVKSVSCTTVEQNIQLLWEQRDFDFTVKQCLVSAENRAWWVHARHKPLPDGDVKVCVSYDRQTA